jgi:cytochrome b
MTVWDPLVRVCHWSLFVTFFTAYFTEDELLTVHVWAGYAIGCIVVLRVIWGFIGPKHSRFSDFIFGPWKVWGYLGDLISFRATRYIDHSPAGGAMVVVLLIGLAATVWSGMKTYAIEENAGPLAGMTVVTGVMAEITQSAPVRLASEDREHEEHDDSEHNDNDGNEDEFWEDAHEVLADLTLVLVIIHILGVGFTSIVHRENLTRAMITGKKLLQ